MPEFTLQFGSDEAAKRFNNLDDFTQGYVEAMFFTSTGSADDNGGLEHVTLANMAAVTWTKIILDCDQFQTDNAAALARAMTESDIDMAHAGRDFWYTRNGHGVGYWDGDWPEPYATELDEAAKLFGMTDLYLGDDGLLYLA